MAQSDQTTDQTSKTESPASAGTAGYVAGRQRRDRPWEDYPEGTVAHSIHGGSWTKGPCGWTAMGGDTFPRPGADAFDVTPAT